MKIERIGEEVHPILKGCKHIYHPDCEKWTQWTRLHIGPFTIVLANEPNQPIELYMVWFINRLLLLRRT